MDWKSTRIFLMVIIPCVLIIVGVAIFTSPSNSEIGVEEKTPVIVEVHNEKTRVVLDCNRAEGHKVWKLDSITFYKDLHLTLHRGDVKETVDASKWLCSIDSEIDK